MTLDNATKIAEHLLSLGYTAEIMPDYSGRFMYGATTAAVIVDKPGFVSIAASHLGLDIQLKHDQFALQSVVY